MNGDGLSDFIASWGVAGGNISTYLNSGTYFSHSSNWYPVVLHPNNPSNAFVVIQNDGVGGRVRWKHLFFDINGDGLADIFRPELLSIDHNAWIFLNNGSLSQEANGSSWVIDENYKFNASSFIGYIADGATRPLDFNGDGLTDIATVSRTCCSFRSHSSLNFNTGREFIYNHDWTTNLLNKMMNATNLGAFYQYGAGSIYQGPLRLRTADINGDLFPDFIWEEKKGFISNWQPEGLLVGITTPQGSKQTITYQPAAWERDENNEIANPDIRINRWIVKEIETYNLDNTFLSKSSFNYSGGTIYFANAHDRKFAGFSVVAKNDYDQDNNILRTTKAYFHQGNESNFGLGENEDHWTKIGQTYRLEVYDGDEKKFQERITRLSNHKINESVHFVYPHTILERIFDGQNTPTIEKATEYLYDLKIGKVRSSIEYGFVTGNDNGSFVDIDGIDNRFHTYSYAIDSDTTLIKRASTTLSDINGVIASQSKIYYDLQPLGSISIHGSPTLQEILIDDMGGSNRYAKTTWQYNFYGLHELEVGPINDTTQIIYDQYNLYPSITTNALGHESKTVYDYKTGKLSISIDPNKNLNETLYDGLGRIIQNDISTSLNTTVKVSEYRYVNDTFPNYSIQINFPQPNTPERVIYTYFDGLGRPIQTKQISETGNWLTSDIMYDELGREKAKSLPYESPSHAITLPNTQSLLFTHFSYDPLDRIISQTNSLGSTLNNYSGARTEVIDPEGNQIASLTDAFGNIKEIQEFNEGLDYHTHYSYNLNNNLTAYTDADGKQRFFAYDNINQRLSATDIHSQSDPDVGSYYYSYDDAGNLKSTTQPNGTVINNTYDLLKRLMITEVSSGERVTYIYDSCSNGIGRLCQVSGTGFFENNFVVYRTNYSYNLTGNIIERSISIDGHATDCTITYQYNNLNELIQTNYPDSIFIHQVLNKRGLPKEVEYFIPSKGAEQSFIAYSPHGQISEITHPNGVTTNHTYDPNEQYRLISTLTLSPNGKKLQDTGYKYDDVGNIREITDASDSLLSKTTLYTYDDLYRLKKAEVINSGNNQDYIRTYEYGATGNITYSSDLGTYLYEETGMANPQAVTKAGGNNFTYDANGNIVTIESTTSGITSHLYNYQNQIIKTILPSQQQIHYLYDHNGQRLVRVGENISELYVDPSFSWINGKPQITVDIPSTTLTTIENNAIYYNHSDHLNSTSVLTNEKGQLVELLDYFPFGDDRFHVQLDSFSSKVRYTGHKFDEEIRLTYANARYYDSQMKRWMQQDPAFIFLGSSDYKKNIGKELNQIISDPQQLNSYSYVTNNPLIFIDPSGTLRTELAIIGVSVATNMSSLFVSDLVSIGFRGGKFSNQERYNNAAAAGAVGGLTYLISKNVYLSAATTGSSQNFYDQLDDNGNNFDDVDWTQVASNGAVSTILAGGLKVTDIGLKLPGITYGNGSFDHVTNTLLTKLANGQIKNISNLSNFKIIVSQLANDAPGAFLEGLSNGVIKEVKQNKSKRN